MLYIAIDGTGVPMVAAETEGLAWQRRGRHGTHPRGQAVLLLHPDQPRRGRPGATAILTLRCQQASGRWEEIWQQPPHHTGAA
jgi:hypothetical protein